IPNTEAVIAQPAVKTALVQNHIEDIPVFLGCETRIVDGDFLDETCSFSWNIRGLFAFFLFALLRRSDSAVDGIGGNSMGVSSMTRISPPRVVSVVLAGLAPLRRTSITRLPGLSATRRGVSPISFP